LYIDTGFTAPTVNSYGDYFNHFDHTKYTAGQSITNMVDEANVATGINLTNVVAWDGESNSTGTGYNGALDFLPAETTRDRFVLTSTNTMELQFDVSGYTDWASKTYKIYGGGFRQFLGSESGGAGESSTDNYSTQYDWSCAFDAMGGADPSDTAQTFDLDAVPNGSGIISLKIRKAVGATEVDLCWLKLEIYS
jgi:hypothetical protein